MGTPGPAPEITLDDALGVFTTLDRPSTPLTASEVAEKLNCTRRTAHRKLETLAEQGDLETKKTGAHSRVWWRPAAAQGGVGDAGAKKSADLAEFGNFVADVEDYAIFTLEPDGTVATWNEGAGRIKGYEESEIVGKHFSTFYTEEAIEAGVPEQNLAGAREHGRIEDEGWRLRADGTQFLANVVITAIRNDDGELQGFTKVTRDMTDRREYEQRLQRQRKRTEDLLETAPVPIAVQDDSGEVVMANERATEALGLGESTRLDDLFDAEGWSILDAEGEPIDEPDLPAARVLETGEPIHDEEIVIEDPSGERTWFAVDAAPVTGSEDDDRQVVVAGEDITGLKRREQELETELSELLGRVSDAFYALDHEWRFTHVNDRAEAVLQQSEAELLGTTYGEVFPDAWESTIGELFRRALDTQEPQNVTEYYDDADRWLEYTVYPSETGLSVYFQDVTERKERQHQLAKYGTIVETMNDGIYVKDQDGHFTMVNDAYAEMTGYDREELVGAHASLVVDEETIQGSKTVLEGEQELPLEAPIERADGETIAAEGTFATLASGEEVGVVRDVTERKERERALERYEQIVETVNDGIYVVDDDGYFTMVNKGYAEMLGFDPEELLGEHVSLVVDDEVRDAAQAIEAELSGGESEGPVLEAELETASGERIPAEATFSVFASADGELRRIGVARDISDRIEYQRELERKERRYQAVFEDPNILVGLLEPDGTVLDINDTAMEYIDAELEDVVGEQFAETPWWAGNESIEADVRRWVQRAADGEYVDFEADLTRPDGERYVLSGYFRPVTNDDGEVVSIIVSDRDITEQTEYQQELERSEQRYRTLVENFPNGAVGLVDQDLRYQIVGGNPVDEESESSDDLEGKTVREALSPELADVVEPRYRAALEGEPSTVEIENDGSIGQIQIYPVRDENGEVFAAMGMSQDITERVERERYLEDAKARLEAATEAGAVGTWEWNIEEDLMVANPSFAETFGLDPAVTVEGVSLDRFVEHIHEDDRERVERQIEEAIETRSEYESEYRVWDADGDLRWVVARGHVETDEAGNPTTFPGAITDITKRREYQNRIEESERRYRTLVENFPDGAVGLYDEDLTYTAVGGQLLDEVGVPAEERIGQSVYDIYPDSIVEEVGHYFEDALAGEANSFETEFHDRRLSANTLPVTDADGGVIGGMLLVQDVTERYEAQEDLRESEAKFRMIAENLEEVVWMTTPDAEKMIYLNPAFEEVWGIDRQELYDDALAFIDRIHPEDQDRVETAFAALPDEPFEEEYRILRPDGEVRWVHARGTHVTDEESGMSRIVGIGEDVTERVQRERELERALDLLERTERIAEVGGWEIDVDTMDVFWSDHLFDIVDYDGEEEPPLENALDVYHPDDRAIVEDAVEDALETGASFDVESRFPRPEGGVGWLRVQGDPEVEGGDVISLRGAVQDVTGQVERERELEDRARQQRAVSEIGQLALETANIDEIMDEAVRRVAEVLDVDYCKVLDMDEAGEELLLRQGVGWQDGIVGSATVGAHEDDSQAGYTLESDEPVVVEDLETDSRFGGPELLTSHDVSSGISTIIGSSDDPWGILGTHDTERRSFSDEDVNFVRSVANVLAGAIERHRYQRELEELVDQLEESNERLERFAYVASHDLQEPLRMISNYLQLLERRYRDELDDDAEEFIDFAVDGAERMREMIEDLLAYSRLDTEAEPFEPTDADDVVETVLEDLRLKIEETDAEITVGDLPTVVVDENQLEMVFQNLLSNAIKYCGDEPPQIDVGVSRGDGEWVFHVSDEGIGIDPERADDVFDVFNRLHTHEEYPGTGIGLAMCKKIVGHHGGEIWVESERGEGSTFYFTMPDHRRNDNIASMTQIDASPVEEDE